MKLANADMVIANSTHKNVDIMLDYEHEFDQPLSMRPNPIKAAGWIKELLNREGSLWAKVKWTDAAQALIAAGEYRYFSPVVLCRDEENEIFKIIGGSLVHRPAIDMKSIASQQEPEMPGQSTDLATIAEALGLDADAPLQAVLDAIAGMGKVDPEKYVPIEAVADLMAERGNKATKLSQCEVNARVDAAMFAGHLTPAMRPWATELCQQSVGAFEKFVASSSAPYKHVANPQPGPWDKYASPDEIEAGGSETVLSQQLGLSPDRLRT